MVRVRARVRVRDSVRVRVRACDLGGVAETDDAVRERIARRAVRQVYVALGCTNLP